MNTLIEKINSDYITAYKAKDESKISVLRLLKSALKNAEIAKKSSLDESEVIAVLKKEAKQRKDSIEVYTTSGRNDTAKIEADELEIISSYLPNQMPEDEARKIIEDVIAETGAKSLSDMGRVIGTVMAKHKDSMDGGMVSAIVKDLLSKQN